MTRATLGLALAGAILPGAHGGAQAHAVIEPREAFPNAAYRGTVRIMHGCDGAPTTRVSVTIPEGVTGAKPMPKPGWEITTVKGAYAKPYPSFHGTVSEGVKTITWSGGSLPDDQVDEFVFFARVSDAFAPGTSAYFPVEQDCASGGGEAKADAKAGYRWSEIPAPGTDSHALKSPAPAVRIVAKGSGTQAQAQAQTQAGAAETKAGDVVIRTPWMRAVPGGAKVAGGYVTLVNTGSQPDRLVGASIPLATGGEIHDMTTEGGVMRMKPVTAGLAIAPGQSVELKPGGLHLMFTGLTGGPKPGEAVTGTLVFEKAGSVPVTFTVAPIGAVSPTMSPAGAAAAPGAGGDHQHQH